MLSILWNNAGFSDNFLQVLKKLTIIVTNLIISDNFVAGMGHLNLVFVLPTISAKTRFNKMTIVSQNNLLNRKVPHQAIETVEKKAFPHFVQNEDSDFMNRFCA